MYFCRLPVLLSNHFAEITTHGSIVHIMTRRHHPWHQVPSTKHQAPSTKHQAPNIKHGQIQRSIWPSSTRQSCALPFRKCLDLDQNMKSHPQLDDAFWILMSYFGVQVCPITFHAGCFHLLENITKSLLAKSLHVPHATEIKGGD